MGFDGLFTAGALLCFDPFWFPDGGTPKRKYFVVLHRDAGSLLLVSLPTTKDHVPSDIDTKPGCMEIPERNFNAFVFPAGSPVTETFAFPRDTYIYGGSVHAYSLDALKKPVEESLSAVSSLGHIIPSLFMELLTCMRESSAVRRKYRNLLRT